MKKIHGPAKRKFKLGKTLRHYFFFHPQGKKKRPKTFYSAESANKWASEHEINNYTLKKVKKNKKFQIVEVQNGKS